MKISAAILLILLVQNCYGLDVEAKMLASGSAVLTIDGKNRMLKAGDRSPEGVLLISADGKQAVIEVEGKRKNLKFTNGVATQFKAAEKTEVRIASSNGGHYRTKGLINGSAVDFLVDTGATCVSMGAETAERLGIDYRAGIPVSMSTANGTATGFRVMLNSVSVGNIVINNVVAVVSSGDFATELLLGNSYLSKVDLKIDQGVLVLKEK